MLGAFGVYGLFIESNPTKRRKLADYLQKEGSQTAFTITDRAGWNGEAYILAGGEAVNADGTNILSTETPAKNDGLHSEKGQPQGNGRSRQRDTQRTIAAYALH